MARCPGVEPGEKPIFHRLSFVSGTAARTLATA
jgi:hypothetical protein